MSLTLFNLRGPSGSRHARKLLGRGPGSGHGKTSGKGHKGQKARRGKCKPRPGFEGGQNPLIRRLPKFGFFNVHARPRCAVGLKALADLKYEGEITPEVLKNVGLAIRKSEKIKIIGSRGFTLDRVLKVKAHAISAAARSAIESRGGTFEEIK